MTTYTDEQIREMIIERRRKEAQAQKHEERLAVLKVSLRMSALFALGVMVWAASWIGYALQ